MRRLLAITLIALATTAHADPVTIIDDATGVVVVNVINDGPPLDVAVVQQGRAPGSGMQMFAFHVFCDTRELRLTRLTMLDGDNKVVGDYPSPNAKPKPVDESDDIERALFKEVCK